MKKGLIIGIIVLIIIAVLVVPYFIFKDSTVEEPLMKNDISEPLEDQMETVSYKLTFSSTWSEENHPENFPSTPHWSGLIGASHNSEITYWEIGGISSDGIELVAETGGKGKFIPEIENEILNGNTNQVISGGGIGKSPGEVSVEFEMDEDYPLVTIISMIAPSPDWFVGVNGLNLFEGGKWVDKKEIELVLYDAGTDSGEDYTSSNSDTVPREGIVESNYGPILENPIGTFVFEKI